MVTPVITILGGDLRQCYAAEYLAELGLMVTCFHTPDFPYREDIQRADSLKQALEQSSYILLPTPLSRDGMYLLDHSSCRDTVTLNELFGALLPGQILFGTSIPECFLEGLEEKNVSFHALSEIPSFTRENSRLTGEGLLSELIRATPFALCDASVLLLGYGNCGKVIGKLLLPLCREVYVLEQNPEKQTALSDLGCFPVHLDTLSEILSHCEIVVNTIPEQILLPAHFRHLPDNCHLFDIASAPFGFPEDITAEYSLPCYRLPGIPGRFSPQTAGHAIGRAIERMTEHEL